MAKPRGHFFWAIACAAAFLAAVGCNRSAPDSDSKSNIEQALSASRTSVTDVGNTPSVDGGSTCTGILGAATFQRAICSCDAIHASAHLATDGFDSSKGPPNGGLGGSVGSNNGEAWSAHVSIGGDLATPASLQASASSEVRGNLDLGGTLTAGPPFTVDGNARVVKPLPHNVTVRGTVTHLSSVAAPCDCSHIIPIAAMVAAHRARANDDAAIGLSANAATGSNPARIDLPSGNYYLARIQTGRPLTIFAHGHTALYVDGDVTASTPLRFQLDPTATLDLFVAGNVASSAAFTLGSASSPAHCRAYFAGVSFDMSAGATIGCNVYAPAAQFDTSASGDVHGSLFVGNFNASANASVHYDVSIRNAGGECCTAQACDDGNPCTVDSCKGDGTCSHAPAANGTVCHGANKCEQTFTCQNGACSGSDPVMCVASDACHVAGTCDPATGACSNPAAADGTICNDGNACTQTDTCTAGTCTGANPVVCTASDQCHLAGTCDPANGLCKNPAAPDGTPCDDGNACTTGDSCAAGACKGGSAVPVDDGNPCTTDSCDPVSGVKHVPVPAGTSCSDGNACNGAETCNGGAGSCLPGTPIVCPALDQCHVAGTCDPVSGACSNPASTDGTRCSDGNACTQSDACKGGTCVSGTPIACTALDQCHLAGTCDPTTGACSNPPKPDGTAPVWSTKAPMLTPRYQPGAVVYNGIAYVIGGCSSGACGDAVTATVEAYDPVRDAWSTRSSMPTDRGWLAVAAINGVAYAVGGTRRGQLSLATVEAYDLATDKWTSKASMANPRIAPAAGAIGGKLYVAGGHCCVDDGALGATGSLEIYDPTTDTWTAGAAMPTERAYVGYGVLENKLYVVGGIGRNQELLTTVEVYDPVSGSWTSRKPMPVAQEGLATAALGGKLYVAGGSSASSVVPLEIANQLYVYDPAQDSWTSGPSMPTARYGARAATIGPNLFVAGGFTAGGVTNVLEVFGSVIAPPTCDDGNACTHDDICIQGQCVGSPVTCTAADSCHVAGACDPASGACSNPLALDGTTCNDGNACTRTDACSRGTCIGSNPVACGASDQCHTPGTCNPSTGACSSPPAPDGTTCSGSDKCNGSYGCQSGACVGSNPVTCVAQDECHAAGNCDPASGACTNPPVANGTVCSDGNACTQNDVCQSGACMSGSAIVCAPSDPCHLPGMCDPASGTCSNPLAPNGTSCNDGNACTQCDTCQNGSCAGSPVVCSTSDSCHAPGTCDPDAGTCSAPTGLANGTSCPAAAIGAPQCDPPLPGLAAWWPGDGNANDIASGQSNGTLVGAAFAPGQVGQGFDLSGGAHVEVPDNPSLDFAGGITVEAWIYPRPGNPSGGIITKLGDVGGNEPSGYSGAWYMAYNDVNSQTITPDGVAFGHTFQFDVHSSGGHYRRFTPDGSVPVNAWTHVAATAGCGVMTLYVNGEKVQPLTLRGEDSDPSPAPIQPHPTPLFIGTYKRSGAVEQFFNGIIDEPTVYNRVLSADEIRTIYAAGSAGKCKGSTSGSSTGVCQAGACNPVAVRVSVPGVVGLPLSAATSAITTASLAVGTVTNVPDGLVSMQFDVLPSLRGWFYSGGGNAIPEERVFHVQSATLFQDSMGSGGYYQASNAYFRYGLVVPSAPFVLRARVRVLDEEGDITNNSYGFAFGAGAPGAECAVGIGKHRIQDSLNAQVWSTVDGSVFHDYRLECNPATGYQFFVDGALLGSGQVLTGLTTNRIFIGDGTGGANARAEITDFEFEQPLVVQQRPGAGTLVQSGSAVDLDVGRGPATAVVPDLSGVLRQDVAPRLATANLTVGEIRLESSNSVPAGQVLRQRPIAGSTVQPGMQVAVTVAKGPVQCVTAPAGLRAWWRGEGDAKDEVTSVAGQLTPSVAFEEGEVGQAFLLEGPRLLIWGQALPPSGTVELPSSVALTFSGGFSVEAWIRPSAGSGVIVMKTGAPDPGGTWLLQYLADTAQFGFTFCSPGPSVTCTGYYTPNGSAVEGRWTHVAATVGSGVTRLFLDGIQRQSAAAPDVVSNSGAMMFGAYDRGSGQRDEFFGGELDELSIYDRALDPAEIQRIVDANVGGKCPIVENAPPVVSAGPDQTITLPASATLAGSVSDDGLPPGGSLTSVWSAASGPGTVTFASPNSPSTTAAFSVPGVYVLRLTASDGALSTSADVTIAVTTGAPSLSDAGSDAGTCVPTMTGCASAPLNLTNWWRGEGNTTDSIAGTSATPQGGVTFVPGEVGQAFGFNGTDSYLDIDDAASLRGLTAFSIEAWVKVTQSSPEAQYIYSELGNLVPQGGARVQFYVQGGTGRLVLDVKPYDDTYPGQDRFGVDSSDALQLNVWYHVAGVWQIDHSTITTKVYVNCVETSASAPALLGNPISDTPPAAGVNFIGAVRNGLIASLPLAGVLSGAVDELKLFHRALSAGEISTLFNAGSAGICLSSSDAGSEAGGASQGDAAADGGAPQPDGGSPPPTNQAPVVGAGPDQTVTLPNSATLAGTVTDDGLPMGALVTSCWSVVSGPATVTFASPCSAATTATFTAPGTYVLQLQASDTALTSSSDVTITVLPQPVNQPPVVIAGPDQTVNLPNTVLLSGTVTDDGLPKGGTLTSFWTQVSGPAPATFSMFNGPTTTVTFTVRGLYVFRLTANDGQLESSGDVHVTVYDPITGPPPTVAISSPVEAAEITTLTDVVGTVGTPTLDHWTLSQRALDVATFTDFATGTTPVAAGVLGTLDPTLLLNGVTELQLTAVDTSGQTSMAAVRVVLTRNLKVGNFTVSFKDLSVPVAGIPIEVVRTYDSRDKRVGDFGVGWTLDIKSVRVQKNRTTGDLWQGTVEPGSFFVSNFCVRPVRPHIVTVTFSDGKVFRWEAHVSPECQAGAPLDTATVSFAPQPGTNASLTLDTGSDVIVSASFPGDAQLLASDGSGLFDPAHFVVTLLDGRQLRVAELTGLEKVTDTNGNVLEVKPGGLFHSSGQSIVFARDALGRIAQITEPSGHTLGYTYDAHGDLVSFADASGNMSQYAYDAKHFLLSIQDPRGIQPIRNEYDASGRLLGHVDAFGNVISYDHQIAARTEVVTDRLGHKTTHAYDDRGNVLQTTDPLGHVTSYTYDERDNKLTETNALGQTTTYTYDALDDKTSETDALGNVTAYTYDNSGNVLSVSDPLGRVTSNSYDAHGNLTKTADAAGNVTTNEYSASGLLVKTIPDGLLLRTTDALGGVTTYAYDATGNLAQETDPAGRATTHTYDANGNRLTQTTLRTTSAGPLTIVTQYKYDASNRLVSTVQPDGSTTSTEYNAIGQQAASVDPLGRRTTRTYDALGRLTRTDYADGTFETTEYDAEGRRTASTDRGGRRTQFAYDDAGRSITTTFADGATTSTTYDATGRTAATTDELGHTTSYDYDAVGRRTKVTDPLANASTFVYDAAGNETTTTDALGHAASYTYDSLNRRVKTTYADGTSDLTEYDALGRRTLKIDQAGVRTEYSYDAVGRLVSVKDAMGGVTRYAYDEQGNEITQTDALGRVTTFDYDAMNRRVKRTLPAVAPATSGAFESMTYDAAGNLASKTDFMGQTIAYAYDANNRLTQKLYRDATTVGFTYTATGRRATAVDARGTVAYAYDLRDRIISMKYPDGRKLEYAYDARGNRTLLRAVVGTTTLATTYTYDRAARLATVMDSNGGVYTYGYDANGARTQLTQPNGAVTTYAYNAPNRLTNLKTVHTPSGTTIQSYAYTLGPTGIRTRIDEADGTTRAYGYDALYRLTSESVTGSAGTDYTKTFAYDAVGNRLHQVTTGLGGATVDYAYDARDRLLTENGAPYTWDDNGNMLSKAGDATYAWDAENRLLTASEADGTLVQYAYDPYGVRVQTVLQSGGGGSVQARAYLVDIAGALSQVAVESDGTGAVTESYVRGGEQLLGLIHAAGPAGYYAQDGLGSVRKLVARDGGVTDSYGYTGFGEALGLMGGDAQPYRFGGEEYDLRTGLLYNRARWLAPSIGSFLAIDSVAGNVSNPKSLHRYAYAYLDPIDNVDPTGKVTLVEVSTAATIAGILSVVPEQSLAATKQPERYNCATSPEPFTKVSAKFQNGWAIAAGAAAHGSILASAAVVVADAMRTVNCCAKGVITALNLAGLTVPARDAWELAGILAREERFVELADYDLFEPPIGSIGIVANGSMTGEYVPSFGPAENIARLTHARSLDYGHAFIYVGGQLEASDHLQPYSVRLGVGLRMFLPVQ